MAGFARQHFTHFSNRVHPIAVDANDHIVFLQASLSSLGFL